MKLLLVITLACLSFSQKIEAQVLGTPISITEEGQTQKPGEDPEVAKARSELEASKVKPSVTDPSGEQAPSAKPVDELGVSEDQSPDGTISGEVKPTKAEEKKEEKVEGAAEVHEVAKKPSIDWKRINFFAAPRWFRLTGGRLWSTWSKIDSSLEDGSLITGFRIVQPVEGTPFSMAFGLDVVHGSGDSFNAESVRSTHVVLENEYDHSFTPKFSLVYGLSLEYADSNIRKVIGNNSERVTYEKFASGSTFGLVPAVSLRVKPADSFMLDLTPGYAFYFASPHDEMGGLSLRLRLNFAL